ncbi:hypothetical protein COOONC_27071, partial [Cooperia oncophora]
PVFQGINGANEETSRDDRTSIVEVNQREGVDEYLFEGDILLTNTRSKELKAACEHHEGLRIMKQQLTEAYIRTILNYLQARTCITFVDDATATNRIRVFDGAGCYSALGMQGGEQSLSLSPDCVVVSF